MSVKLKLPLGIYDDLENQDQPVYYVDLYRSNVAVFGNIQSGKTTLLKTIIHAIHHIKNDNIDELIYVLDFSNMLAKYADLPFVLAYFDASRRDNVRRMFKEIEKAFSVNTARLGFQSFIECEPSKRPPHITFIIDGLNVLFSNDNFADYQNKLQKFAREGLSKGITVVFTANENTGGIGRLVSSFGSNIALDLSREKLIDLFPSRPDKPISLKGRGIANFGTMAYEFQAFLPYNGAVYKYDDEANRALCSDLQDKGINVDEWVSRHLKTFKGDLEQNQLSEYVKKGISVTPTTQGECILGIDHYSFELTKLKLMTAGSIAIYGKKGFGKSNLLKLILDVVEKIPNALIVLYDDKRQSMKTEIESWPIGYKLANKILPVGTEDASVVAERLKEIKVEDPKKFIVYIIQNRAFYKEDPDRDVAPVFKLRQDIENAGNTNSLFVFANVPRIIDHRPRINFNSIIEHMFIFDDILRFYDAAGADSLIAERRRDELKENFGECQLGSGFYLNVASDDLTMVKFIKAD